MSATIPQHQQAINLIEANRDLIPAGYDLGYDLPHTHGPDGTALSEAERIRADNQIKANLRKQVSLRGSAAQAADIPADGTSATTIHVMFEIRHLATGITVYRAVPVADVIALLTNSSLTTEQRRQQIRTKLQEALDAAVARVGA